MIKDDQGNLIWRPTLKQERFLSIPLTVKEGFYAGALMAGKSDVLLMYPVVHGWHKHPQFKGLFLRRTMPELRNEIIPRAKNYFRPLGATYNKQDGIFEFPSGALYFMGHCENEDDVHKYDSMQPNYAAFDELTSFTQWIYLYILIQRVRVSKNLEGELPQIVRAASNPGNIGHKFVYERFVKPYPSGGKILKDHVSAGKRIYIPATIDDNPYASEQYKRELEGLPEAERRAKKYGDWLAYEGQVFDEFRDKLYPGEPDNAIHVVDEFTIPSWWPRICAIDWGFSAMCSVGWAAISPKQKVYVYRHQMFYGKKIEEWAPQVNYYVERENPVDIVICHSANQHRGDPHTILEQVTAALGTSVRLGERDRVGGKMMLHEYLRWKQRIVPKGEELVYDDSFANWLFRNKGERAYQQYLNQFKVSQEENIPRLLFFDEPDVRVICDTIKACVYEKSGKDGKVKEDVAEFPGDDPYDMLRMLLHVADVYFATATDAQKNVERIEKINNQLEATQDMTAFYREMKHLESSNEDLVQPISRYHRPRVR